MFWDKAAALYDVFENLYNGKVNKQLCEAVADMMEASDRVLECACGTGMLSVYIGKRCKELVATDFSNGMLRQAKKKCKDLPNVAVKRANIMQLKCKAAAFDKVVAGNVIHYLDEPYAALKELERVCKVGGKIIIPTYVDDKVAGKPGVVTKLLEKLGADFNASFVFESYKDFFEKAGYADVEYKLIEGRMPCAIAIITKR